MGLAATLEEVPFLPRRRAGNGVAVDGERIRQARRRKGLSLEAVAGREFTRALLSAVELGRVRPSLKTLAVIASRLGYPIEYFRVLEPEVPLTEGLADEYVSLARYTETLARSADLTETQVKALQALGVRLRRFAVVIVGLFEPDPILVAGGAGEPVPLSEES